MPLFTKLKNSLRHDWIVGLGLFFIFLTTNGYTYAWDDQHLEIPLLKSLIDPQLYHGDYYVDALKTNFTSFLFPLLAKVITVDQVPAAYFVLYLISRFFLFFYAYKLWKIVAKDRFNAALCVLSIILIFRVEEFLYRTFSHQEFALAIIMAGMYYFYKNRFIRAAVLFGVAANVHALYSLFPFCYLMLYLFWQRGEGRWKNFSRPLGAFILFSLPFIIWTLQRFMHNVPIDKTIFEHWITLYQIACPQTFLFQDQNFSEMFKSLNVFWKGTAQFWPVIGLFAVNWFLNPGFRKDQKAQAFIVGGCIFILISFVFSYIFPSRFILDLNLVRNLQFMQFILVGYTTLLLIVTAETRRFAMPLSSGGAIRG